MQTSVCKSTWRFNLQTFLKYRDFWSARHSFFSVMSGFFSSVYTCSEIVRKRGQAVDLLLQHRQGCGPWSICCALLTLRWKLAQDVMQKNTSFSVSTIGTLPQIIRNDRCQITSNVTRRFANTVPSPKKKNNRSRALEGTFHGQPASQNELLCSLDKLP